MKFKLGDYGMILVLIGLCALFSALTFKRQSPDGPDAAAELAEQALKVPADEMVIVAGKSNSGSGGLAKMVGDALKDGGRENFRVVIGEPIDLREALDELRDSGGELGAVVTGGDAAEWRVMGQIGEKYPMFSDYEILLPGEKLWPTFLTKSNLLAVVERIVVIAIIAIGMTMVIITAGIDLSVGSLIALSAVVSGSIVKSSGGSTGSVILGFAAGIAACGAFGLFAGAMVARFKVAAFIVTLGIMLMARGLAFMVTGGFSIDGMPDAYVWLAQGKILGIPNTVLLLILTYTVAHVFMSHTRYGRYIYAVGGNKEAARLTGVPVVSVLILVYVISGIMAGIGGCLQAGLVRAAAPNMAQMYELYVIAAVVVGGTSLAGGSGRIFGTLIGAFIIAVIQNGMNLILLPSYTQTFVLGAVIVAAVLLDQTRRSGGIRQLLQSH